MDRALAMLNMSGFGIGTFALPFVQSFFPASYLTYVCLFDIGNSLLSLGGTYTLASIVARPDEKVSLKRVAKSLLSSMPFCTYIFIFFLVVCGIKIPDRILIVINIPGNANAFLCMLMIGIMLELKLRKSEFYSVWKYLCRRYAMVILFGICVFCLRPWRRRLKRS